MAEDTVSAKFETWLRGQPGGIIARLARLAYARDAYHDGFQAGYAARIQDEMGDPAERLRASLDEALGERESELREAVTKMIDTLVKLMPPLTPERVVNLLYARLREHNIDQDFTGFLRELIHERTFDDPERSAIWREMERALDAEVGE